MTEKKFLVHLIIDESGSMAPQRSDVIGGVTEYLRGLIASGDTYRVGLTFFDANWEPEGWIRTHAPADPATVLTKIGLYTPRGGTPLYDAVGKVLTGSQPAEGEDVLTVIFTDGEENSSRTWTLPALKALMQEHEARGETFLFLASNPDAWAQVNTLAMGTQSVNNVFRGRNVGETVSVMGAATAAYASAYGTGTRDVVEPTTTAGSSQ